MWRKRLAGSAFLLVLLASALADVASPAWIEISGDSGKVNVVVNYWPGMDRFGRPSVNPDGSFFPNDQLWINYGVYMVEGLSFSGVQAVYDQSAFEKLRDEGWGSTSGKALFKVRADANPGTYDFSVRAEAYATAEGGASGSVSVTFGGVEVFAHYRIEFLLTILPSEHGTTSPAPGSYWHAKGESVSVSAIPDDYYELDYWLLNGKHAGSSNPIGVVMNAPYALQPIFRRIQYALWVGASTGGTTDPPPGMYLYDAGTYVSVFAIPDANYTFSHWILDGRDMGPCNPITVFMDRPHGVGAVFKKCEDEGENASPSTGLVLEARARSPLKLVPLSAQAELKLVVKDLKWTTWFDPLRGTVCQATGYLYDSSGAPVAHSDVVAEFRKRNLWTGGTWIVSKTARTSGGGYFAAEDTCNPLTEQFLGVQAWAEKPGYIPSWSLSTFLDPHSASVGQGSGLLAGVRVCLSGRYTSVPVSLFAEGVPQGCEVSFKPPSGEADGLTPLQSVMTLSASQTAPTGNYTLIVKASSGQVTASAPLRLEVTEPVQVPSAVRFAAYGLDADADGVVLVLDGSQNIYVGRLPYTADWRTNTQHTYSWTAVLSAKVYGKRYVFEKAVVKTRYLSVATVSVEVAKYDPQFTAFAYTIPRSPGEGSYEKHFAVIVRYDGNGPEKDLGKRAVFEGWDWYGHASRIAVQQRLTGLTAIPGLSGTKPEEIAENLRAIMELFNLTRGVTFSAAGMDAETEGIVLKVDGEGLTVKDLPKTYSWPENATHTYKWTVRMPVYTQVGYGMAWDEWFSFEYALITPPQVELKGNVTLEEAQRLLMDFASKLPSPSGSVKATMVGSKVIGVYSHNKLLESVAREAGVSRNDALKFVNFQLPVFFSNESRYVKFIFDLDDRVAAEALGMGYNVSLTYRVTFTTDAFSPRTHAFSVNFTCPLEYYRKDVEVKAFRWDRAAESWSIDGTVRVEALLSPTFNTTEENWFRSYLEEQEIDEVMLEIASKDIYECHPQYFGGVGSASGTMNRTSAFLYNLNATAGRGTPYLGVYPHDGDALTENIENAYAWWDSPSCRVSADWGRKTAGLSSIMVDAEGVATACALLHLIKPADAPSGSLSFDIYLGEGCSGKVTVVLLSPSGIAAMNETVGIGSWRTVTLPAGGEIHAVGIYAELAEPAGRFWIDRLRFTNAWLWRWKDAVSIAKTVYVDFASSEPLTIYANLDPSSPLPVNVTSDGPKTSRLTVEAAPELGGLAKITAYAVASAPHGYMLKDIPVEGLQLRRLFSLNLTVPEEWIEDGRFSGYRGYSSIRGGVLGFSGRMELLVAKDPEMKALPGYDDALLLIEAENVWGTRFHAIVAVQPWGKTFWEVMFEQVAMALIGVAAAAIIVGLIIKFLRESR